MKTFEMPEVKVMSVAINERIAAATGEVNTGPFSQSFETNKGSVSIKYTSDGAIVNSTYSFSSIQSLLFNGGSNSVNKKFLEEIRGLGCVN